MQVFTFSCSVVDVSVVSGVYFLLILFFSHVVGPFPFALLSVLADISFPLRGSFQACIIVFFLLLHLKSMPLLYYFHHNKHCRIAEVLPYIALIWSHLEKHRFFFSHCMTNCKNIFFHLFQLISIVFFISR